MTVLASLLALRGGKSIEQVELEIAWLDTLVAFALPLLLGLLMLAIRQRRSPNRHLAPLFRPRTAPDVSGRIQRWRADRARRVATAAAAAAASASRRKDPESAPKSAPDGPVVGSFGRGLGAGFAVALAIGLGGVLEQLSGPDPNGLFAIALVIYGTAAVFNAFMAAGLCALMVNALPRRHPAIATGCGMLTGAIMIRLFASLEFFPVSRAFAVLAGGVMGLVIGLAGEASREPPAAQRTG